MAFRVFIGNLPYALTDEQLGKEAAALKLTPTEVSVAKRQRDGKPLGFGFFTFATSDAATKAIESLSGKSIGERPVRAELAYTEETQKAKKTNNLVLHVGNLPDIATSDDVAKIFDGFKLTRHEVILNHEGKSKGFGYVGFASAEEMERAMKECKGTTVEDKEITLELARPQRPRRKFPAARSGSDAPAKPRAPRSPRKQSSATTSTPPTSTPSSEAPKQRQPRRSRPNRVPDEDREKADAVVHVGNLSYKAETADVQAAFAKYHPTKVNVVRLFDGRSKGFAFVEFASAADATKALELNGAEVLGRAVACNIAFKQIVPKKQE